MTIVGFTGTQQGMTEEQKFAVRHILNFVKPAWVHHGDCIGADADLHQIAVDLNLRIILHPCDISHKRARCVVPDGQERPPMPPLARNHHIVDSSDVIVAAPGEHKEKRRSGTWATIRYARKRRTKLYVVYPNGNIDDEGENGEIIARFKTTRAKPDHPKMFLLSKRQE